MVKVSKNLNRRLQILREQIDLMRVCKENNRQIDRKTISDCQKSMLYCKELLRKELINTNINNLL